MYSRKEAVMAKKTVGVEEICACGAVKCDGEWTKTEGAVIAAKSAGILPFGLCCECRTNGKVRFGGFSDHSSLKCCM
jgi:hypothetical protein